MWLYGGIITNNLSTWLWCCYTETSDSYHFWNLALLPRHRNVIVRNSEISAANMRPIINVQIRKLHKTPTFYIQQRNSNFYGLRFGQCLSHHETRATQVLIPSQQDQIHLCCIRELGKQLYWLILNPIWRKSLQTYDWVSGKGRTQGFTLEPSVQDLSGWWGQQIQKLM